MNKAGVLAGCTILCLSLLTTNAQAHGDDHDDTVTHRPLRDPRKEIENISGDPQRMRTYVDSRKDVNARYRGGKTLLHYAALKNYRDIAASLLARGADINAADDDKRTPLHEAMSYSAYEVVGLLLDKGADVNRENKYDETPLRSIVFWDQKKRAIEVANLFMGKGVDLARPSHATLLDEAIRRERRDLALIFLKNGFGYDESALIDAARKGYEDIFALLLEKGVQPQKVTFHDACASGNMNIVRTLAEKGVKPTADDIDFCLFNGHKEAAVHLSTLLKNGTQADIRRRCHLEPTDGTCKALLEGAYFDVKAKVCREFTGCGGVFPFDTLEACRKVCEE
ncbi:ankyrin repeat domain-containing protein [Geobacter luticola]|uniref:Ankyrin repeat domain-containing protein n=2 Tax=Geomobilimonas luticola TaxID=1114878 RepID=A0ABS5SCH2_9BACT|nr:ankyrin repeat domain-containing protein [Geomobilimonas luticola]